MLNYVAKNPAILDTFLEKFQSQFTKRAFLSFSFYVAGLFLELKRTNIQTIVSKIRSASYQNTQYFISEAKWDHEKLNNKRIEILQSNRTTKTCKKGVLVIDDSGCKKWGFKTEGAKVQHYGTEDIITRCNILVASAYCDTSKRYPINLRAYRPKEEFLFGNENPDFKSKIELAKELITDAISKNLNFSDFVFDNWYFACSLIGYIEQKGYTWISEADANRLISYKGTWIHAGDLVKVIPSDKLRRVTVSNSKREKSSFYVCSLTTKIQGLPSKVKVVLAIGKWQADDPKNVHIFVTNHLAYSPEEIIQKYSLRWGIECIFRDLKENVAFDHYQVRYIHAITRHWHLASLAYTFLLWCKLNGYLSKNFSQPAKSLGEQLLLFRKLNSLTGADWIKQNYQSYQSYLGIKKSARRAA